MEELEEFRARLEGARLQVKSLQRAARTTLQVLSELEERATELTERLSAQSEEDTANEYNGSARSLTT